MKLLIELAGGIINGGSQVVTNMSVAVFIFVMMFNTASSTLYFAIKFLVLVYASLVREDIERCLLV